MSRCTFTAPAYYDLIDIHDYIARDSPAAAVRWIDTIQAKCSDLASMPGMGRPREELSPGLRSFAVGAHIIFYRESDDGILVVRVVHGSRDLDSLFQ